MLRKLERIFALLKEPRVIKKLMAMYSNGYLHDIGWFNSFKENRPIDRYGKALPWVTYSFIDFISDRLNKNMSVFEYGLGNSTLWYASKVNNVTSVEHDLDWFNEIKNQMPDNVSLFFEKLEYGKNYSKKSKTLNKKFDVIIVDGRDRVNCMMQAIEAIKDNGVIILDDSERETYEKGIEFLLNEGFKKIDFWGISPGLFYRKCTTIFYKNNNNVLDI